MRTARRRLCGFAYFLVVVWAAACTPALERATLVPAPPAPNDSMELSLFLIGDAGGPAYQNEPVLQEFARQSDSLRRIRRFVVFLGDNVYPKGIPPVGDPKRVDAEQRLAAQIAAIRGAAPRDSWFRAITTGNGKARTAGMPSAVRIHSPGDLVAAMSSCSPREDVQDPS